MEKTRQEAVIETVADNTQPQDKDLRTLKELELMLVGPHGRTVTEFHHHLDRVLLELVGLQLEHTAHRVREQAWPPLGRIVCIGVRKGLAEWIMRIRASNRCIVRHKRLVECRRAYLLER